MNSNRSMMCSNRLIRLASHLCLTLALLFLLAGASHCAYAQDAPGNPMISPGTFTANILLPGQSDDGFIHGTTVGWFSGNVPPAQGTAYIYAKLIVDGTVVAYGFTAVGYDYLTYIDLDYQFDPSSLPSGTHTVVWEASAIGWNAPGAPTLGQPGFFTWTGGQGLWYTSTVYTKP